MKYLYPWGIRWIFSFTRVLHNIVYTTLFGSSSLHLFFCLMCTRLYAIRLSLCIFFWFIFALFYAVRLNLFILTVWGMMWRLRLCALLAFLCACITVGLSAWPQRLNNVFEASDSLRVLAVLIKADRFIPNQAQGLTINCCTSRASVKPTWDVKQCGAKALTCSFFL